MNDIRERIILAGVNWCYFTHGHGGDRAALAAARAIIVIAKEHINSDVWQGGNQSGITRYFDHLLTELAGGNQGTGSEASGRHRGSEAL